MKANESSNTTGRAIILHANDNVATALEDLQKGTVVSFPDRNLSDRKGRIETWIMK